MFFQTGDAPQFDCEIEVRINGVKTPALAVDGLFTASDKGSRCLRTTCNDLGDRLYA